MRTHLLTATFLVATAFGSVAAADMKMCEQPPCSRHEIEAYEHRVQKHMLRTQQARFEAMARGEHKKSTHYDREFKHTQQRWTDAKRAMENASD